jgi:mannose-1-phosphate guanylyltransferase
MQRNDGSLAVIITAGGSGRRLWPLSTRERPKPFWNPFGEETLLEGSFRLALEVADPQLIFIVTAKEHAGMVRQLLPKLPPENIIVEPLARGTTAAIGLASLVVSEKHPDCICAVLGSDYYLPDTLKFSAAVQLSAEAARAGKNLVSVGIKPVSANTAYGYMSCGRSWRDGSSIRVGLAYHEKPDAQTARRYLDSGNMLWNANIFVWSLSTILDCYQRYVADDFHRLKEFRKALSAHEQGASLAIFRSISTGAIDCDIMEKVGSHDEMQHLFLPYEGAWSDVGTFPNLRTLLRAPDGNSIFGPVTATDSRNCLLISEHPFNIVARGIQDLDVVVSYRGDLAICSNGEELDDTATGGDHRSQDIFRSNSQITVPVSGGGIVNLRKVGNLDIRMTDRAVTVHSKNGGPVKAPIDLHIVPDAEAAARHAAGLLADSLMHSLAKRDTIVFVPSAGKTAHAIFTHLREVYSDALPWDRLVVVQMDEYEGVSCSHPGSFAFQLQEELINPLRIGRSLFINDVSGCPNYSPEGYEQEVRRLGGIDVVLHGLGRNGHLGFNEPGTSLDARTGIQKLTQDTLLANFANLDEPAGFTGAGFTLGLATMHEARRIVLAAFGKEKHLAVRKILEEETSPDIPASILKSHPDVSLVLDREAYFGRAP